MRPEMPFIAAGGVAMIGGVARSGGIPSNLLGSVIGTVTLVLVASATADSKIAPLVHAIGMLLLLASVMGAVTAINNAKHKKG